MIKVSIDRQVMQNVMSGVADQLKNKIDLNLNHVKKLCKEQYGIETIVGVENKNANIVIFRDQIACKLDFEVRFPMSVLITTKEDIKSSLPEKNDVRANIDDLPEELDDMTTELDNVMTEELDDIPKELDDITEELDDLLAEELDDIPEELDDTDRTKEQSQIKNENKKK
ncbi:MAG: hypothetical protein PVG40_16730 [Desulfobacterales bacterium]|jgi:ElaB/YqjD/DUF883 family membrane-anchored ribosome-binding protein